MTLMARTSVLTTWLRLLDWAFIDAWYVCISYLSAVEYTLGIFFLPFYCIAAV